MNTFEFSFRDQSLHALPSGGLFWPLENMLVVSDLHLGKSTRAARFGGAQLPPYETTETLTRLATDLINTGARRIICLGDSFDSPDLQTALPEADLLTLATLQAGLDWVWIEEIMTRVLYNWAARTAACMRLHRYTSTTSPTRPRHRAKSLAITTPRRHCLCVGAH